MIDDDHQKHIDDFVERYCFHIDALPKGEEIVDDDIFYTRPIRIRKSILLCGRKSSYFPFHCMVGPDWPIVIITYAMIIVINVVIICVTSPLGWAIILAACCGFFCLLMSYSAVACSDPGIIFKPKSSTPTELVITSSPDSIVDVENLGQDMITSDFGGNQQTLNNSQTEDSSTMACGQCDIRRPLTARHCSYCDVCIDKLDHHCPCT